MKLITYLYQETLHFGAVLDSERVLDLAPAYSNFRETQRDKDPLPVDNFPADMLTFLQGDNNNLWTAAATIVEWAKSHNLSPTDLPFIHPQNQIRVVPPLRNPSKIVCIGLNYHDHCRETNTPVPKEPITFVKYPSSIIGPDDSITWPPGASTQVDYEAELALVIKRTARNVSPKEAFDYVAGYTIVNDISARDVQFSDGQWVRGKSFDTFCPVGPYLVTPDEVGDPHQLAIRCRLNGQLVQDSNTSELIFKIPELIAFITKTSTLLPGDIISTGTPHGTGAFREPPIYLKPGDVVEVELDKLGILRNPIT